MSGPFQTRLLRQFGLPRLSPFGWIVKHLLQHNNRLVEQAAVNLTISVPFTKLGTSVSLPSGEPGNDIFLISSLNSETCLPHPNPGGKSCLDNVYKKKFLPFISHHDCLTLMHVYVQTGQVQLLRGRAESLPLSDGTIDRVFHCNSYYYWTDLDKACNEIKRVMKPGAFMVTTLRMSQLQKHEEDGLFKEVNWQPQLLLEALQRAHFTDVNMKNFQQGSIKYEAIFAAIN
uniref:Zgc:194242 n=1 Tax=Eptatretus burgeri TaxID=7764 RepID=A0A8C4R2I9_EPTBU